MTTQELYNKNISGDISNAKFLYEVRRNVDLQQFVTNMTSYNDSVRILKNRGILTEVAKKATELTLDTANPYEYKRGMDYELDMCYKKTPDVISQEDFHKAQKSVFKNLAKDPNFYTKTLGNIKPTSSPDLDSTAMFGSKTKRTDVSVPVKQNFTDKKNAAKVTKKDEKKNVKDSLGNTEKSKSKDAGIKVMSLVPKKAKGIKQVMEVPGKEKKIRLKEGEIPYDDPEDHDWDESEFANENVPQSSSSMLPFANVKAGMTAIDDTGKKFKVLAIGSYNNLKRYDTSRSFDKFLSSDPSGIDANQVVALRDGEGNTVVRVYGTGGVYVYSKNQQEGTQGATSVIVKPETPEADPNRLKKYTDRGFDIKLDPKANLQRTYEMKQPKLMDLLREADTDFEAEVSTKEVVPNEIEIAEAKAIVIPAVTRARLHRNFNPDRDVAISGGNIWVKIRLGTGYLSKDQLKELGSESNFVGVNPVNNTEVTLIFEK